MGRRGAKRAGDGPLAALGLAAGATPEAVAAARRRLARSAHPDAGGNVEAMQHLNINAEQALATIRDGARQRPPRPRPCHATWRDHPSFTIGARPAEAFGWLLAAAPTLGDLIDEERPEVIEVALVAPVRCWCRLDIVAETGTSTVGLTVAAEPGRPVPDLDTVRDAWIDAVNGLDRRDL